jgi:plastocyanin
LATHTVTIKNFKFNPATIQIAAGDVVSWTNEDNATHTVTAEDGGFDSGNLDNGDEPFEHAFDKAGEFPYVCARHGTMKGSVTVA